MGGVISGHAGLCQRIALCLGLLWPMAGQADERRFRLAAPEVLVESGLLGYLLPRFSLKTGVRIAVVPEGAEAEAGFGTEAGRAVFAGVGATWRLWRAGDHAGAARFADWLSSPIGQRMVMSYEVAGAAPFTPPETVETVEAAPQFEGDAAEGRRVALAQCGRCHVVAPENRMKAIGSTPSFAVLRGFPDWAARFQTFYARRPHGSFTQVEEVTAPFPANRPPPIVPVEVSPGEVEAIIAYVAGLTPADLGAPIHLQ